ncbi:MAG: hypothetical protein R3Y65_06625 [Bacillota bacterium]
MRIGSNFYLFDSSVSLIDRRRIFFIIAAVSTLAFFGRFIDNTTNYSVSVFIEYCKTDRIWFLAFAISNLIHFVTYYNSLKVHLKFIIAKDGLLVMQGGNLYCLPWNHISIVKKKNINFETETYFFIQDTEKLKDKKIYSEEYDKYFTNKTFVYKKEFSIFFDEDKIKKNQEKSYIKFLSWQKDTDLRLQTITTEKLSKHILYSKLGCILWCNTLLSYIGLSVFFILYRIIK